MVLASGGQIASVPRGKFIGRQMGAKIDKRARVYRPILPAFVEMRDTDAGKARRRKQQKKQRKRSNVKLRKARAENNA
jgi:hypothetical protein